MRKELYISKTAAHKAIIRHCKENSVPTTIIIAKAKAVPVFLKGQLVGYHAYAPVNAVDVQPIYERTA